ncbi:MAG: HAD family phosphatase [Rhodobacter sp.]|nr:HAD family phosphatase [Rhodobacter sp.]
MAIEAVVFDIGNVLVEWHPTRPFDRLLGRAAREALFARVDFAAMNTRIDMGADFELEIQALAAAHPDVRDQVLIWKTHALEMFSPEIPRSTALLRALKARRVPVFALTNFGDGTFASAQAFYPVLAEFDRCFVSGRIGAMKPDPAIYAHLETETGVAPDRLLFIDDRPQNVAAAEARGWQGHIFDGPEGLAARLLADGLLTAEDTLA